MTPFRSETVALIGGSPKTVPLSFLRKQGPRGGRMEISRIIIRCELQVDTDGATSITAGGLAGMLTRIKVSDAKGDLWNLTGPEARAKHIEEMGRQEFADPALIAISQTNATRTIYWVLDVAPEKAKRRWDFATTCDSLVAIELTGATAGQVGTGSGLTIDQQNYTVFVEAREAVRSTESKSRREVRGQAQAGTTDLKPGVYGGALRSAFLFKAADHITGGSDLSSIGTVTIDALAVSQIPVAVLQRLFAQEGRNDPASTSDPFVQSSARALPLVWAAKDHKIPDCPILSGEVLVRLDANSVSNVSVVTDIVTRRDERSSAADAAVAMAEGLTGVAVKTSNKTRRDPGAWGEYAAFMPLKAVR